MARNQFRENVLKAGQSQQFKPGAAPKKNPTPKLPKAALTNGDRTVTIRHERVNGNRPSSSSKPVSEKLYQGITGGGTIIAATVGATGLTVLKQLLDGDINVKPVIGGFIVGTMLLMMAFFSVEIATALSLLLLLTSVLQNGTSILEKVL